MAPHTLNDGTGTAASVGSSHTTTSMSGPSTVTSNESCSNAPDNVGIIKDGLAGIVLMLFFAFTLFAVLPNYVDVPDFAEGDILTPSSWPKAILIMGLCFSALLVVLAAYRYYVATSSAQTESEGTPCMQRLMHTLIHTDGRSIILMLWLMCYALAAEPLGIMLTSAIFLPVTTMLYGERRPLIIAFFTATFLAGIYAFFVYVAQVQIMPGTLFMS